MAGAARCGFCEFRSVRVISKVAGLAVLGFKLKGILGMRKISGTVAEHARSSLMSANQKKVSLCIVPFQIKRRWGPRNFRMTIAAR